MQSDMTIPRLTDILDRALDARQIAARQADAATVRQIDRLIAKLPEARLCWQLGTLHLTSPSGATYHITRAGCDCDNGRRCHARACWHVLCFELLLDIFDTLAESADMDADPPVDIPDEPWPPTPGGPEPPEWRNRIVAARRVCWAAL